MVQQQIIQIAIALVAGALLGLEREYHSKPAGFRTMILITVGSCLFTTLSGLMPSADRIASNIVTGIGFIGAGVVFKQGLNVKGITSAATIWMAAAIGMAIGMGQLLLAGFTELIVLAVLIVLSKVELLFDKFYQLKIYEIRFTEGMLTTDELEAEFKKMNLKFIRTRISKENKMINVHYALGVNAINHEKVNIFLINDQRIFGFEV